MPASVTPRLPEIDWTRGFPRHWNGGSAAVTHAFNALSFLFPQAEHFFIETAREAVSSRGIDLTSDEGKTIKAFITQEAIHTQQHLQYNAVLESQGYRHVLHSYLERTQARAQRFPLLTKLALVSGYEHYTAILGHHLLNHPNMLDKAPAELALIWGWHAVEETEHNAVCFDLYQRCGGSWLRRIANFMFVTADFYFLFGRTYLDMLSRDGSLKLPRLGRTLRDALVFFFGRSGVCWSLFGLSLHYLRPNFHPRQIQTQDKVDAWLAANKDKLRIVGDKSQP